MSREQLSSIRVTEVTYGSAGSSKTIRIEIDGVIVRVPVSPEVYAHWHEQFVRPNPTTQQKKRFTTLMNIIRAAYQAGVAEGRSQTSHKQ